MFDADQIQIRTSAGLVTTSAGTRAGVVRTSHADTDRTSFFLLAMRGSTGILTTRLSLRADATVKAGEVRGEGVAEAVQTGSSVRDFGTWSGQKVF